MKRTETPEEAERRRAYLREYMRKRRAENPDLNREARARLLATQPDYFRRYHAKHRAKRNAKAREWKERNPDHKRRLAAKDPEAYRERNRRDAQNRAGRRRGYPPIPKADFDALLDSYLGLCVYCLKSAKQFDHVAPLVAGGPHVIENLVPACASCNASKGSTPLLVWLSRHSHRLKG